MVDNADEFDPPVDNADENEAVPAPDHGLRSSDKPRTGFIAGNTFSARAVQYAVVDEYAVVEGDIIVGTADDMEATQGPARDGLEGIIVRGVQFRWTEGVIPYAIHPALVRPERVIEAIDHWHGRTPIRFIPFNAQQHRDYVVFKSGSGCSSHVGRQGGRQVVIVGGACTAGNIIHEIGHTVGLWHEQSRSDRDQYIEVVRQNIITGMEHNFDQQLTDGDDVGPYDYASIMHYPPDAFARQLGMLTIRARGGQAIGQRTGLSEGDVAAVRAIYPDLYWDEVEE